MHIIHQKNHRFNHQAGFVRDVLFELRKQGEDVPLFGGPWPARDVSVARLTAEVRKAGSLM